MPIINYKDLQYSREINFSKELMPTYQDLLGGNPELMKEIKFREDKFYHLISNSIQVDGHYIVKNIISQINRHLKNKFKILVYVFQSDRFQAFCTPRTNYKTNRDELIILVSQHFFNSLGEYERVSVIAHELAHMVFGHVNIPVDVLIKKKYEIEGIEKFKANLLKWALCRELTADIFSLVASDFNEFIVSRSLIKFNTGLDNVYGDDMIRMALGQYEQIADASINTEISTHPLVPLRIKIINSVVNTNLVKRYGRNVNKDQKRKYLEQYNQCIDDIVYRIYPEVVAKANYDLELLYNMSVAVALSDGKITEKEIFLIDEFSKPIGKYKKVVEDVSNNKAKEYYKEVVVDLTNTAVERSKKLGLRKTEIVPLIRRLLLIAAADGKVEQSELDCILSFAENFGFSRMDIITTLATLQIKK